LKIGFTVVSKAFTVLSDPQKRAVFDQYGPEDANKGRSSGVNYDRSQPAGYSHQSPFARGGSGMHGFGGEEMSPEDLFNMFFGGGGTVTLPFEFFFPGGDYWLTALSS